MKNIFALITIGWLTASCSLAQLSSQPTKPWNATVKIIDETGQPVSGATVQIHYVIPPYAFTDKPQYNGQFSGPTDTNGLYLATHDDRSDRLGFRVMKSGYYTSSSSYRLGDPQQYPQRRGISLTLTLKQIGEPIAMYAKRVQIEVPEIGKPFGYDLKVGDWVTPFGKGNHTDLFFEAQRRWAGRGDFDSSIKVTFPNPDDGFVSAPVPLDQGSELRLPAQAPENGYIPELSKNLSHTPSNGWKNNFIKEQNYYLRVRSMRDEHGNIKSALYGKIYGDFDLDPINSKTTLILFTYYLNPTVNDRNVEFNPSRNLIRDLSPEAEVKAP